jgi:hypothetical protein
MSGNDGYIVLALALLVVVFAVVVVALLMRKPEHPDIGKEDTTRKEGRSGSPSTGDRAKGGSADQGEGDAAAKLAPPAPPS